MLDQAMASFSGITGKFLRENGKMAKRMASEYGDHLKETSIRDNGHLIDKTAWVFSSIR